MQTSHVPSSSASSVRALYLLLVAGLLGIAGVFSLLFWLGSAPMLREDGGANGTVIAVLLSVVALNSLGMGWFWARPKLVGPVTGASPENYWDNPVARAQALLMWVLWEGGAIIGLVGWVLTGSIYPVAVAAFGLVLLLLHSPGAIEGRTE